MKDVKYIVETNEFIVDGTVVKASSLSEAEKKKLMEDAKKNSLLIGSNKSEGSLIV